jgi:hypothetical protein
MSGSTTSFGAGSYDYWLVKTDSSGNVQWNKTYGGTSMDLGMFVVQTVDGGYLMSGSTMSFGAGSLDGWLVKTDASGNMQWNKTYGTSGMEGLAYVIQASDGGYAVCGAVYAGMVPNPWLLKVDANGNMQWNQTYAAPGYRAGFTVVQTTDGGYAIAGNTTTSAFGADMWLAKTDSSGNMQWNKTYGGTGDDGGTAFLVLTTDGGYAIAGETNSFGAGGTDGWLVKTDANGNMQWNKTYGGTGDDHFNRIVQTLDGGYAIGGYTNSFGAGNRDVWFVKTDSYGNMQWSKTFGGSGEDSGSMVRQTSDGGYATGGTTASFGAGSYDFYLVKVGSEGESGLAWTDSTANTVTLYRGANDVYWNYVRVRVWKIH